MSAAAENIEIDPLLHPVQVAKLLAVSSSWLASPSCTASPIMFTLAHSALFIKQELLADRANRKPAGDGFVYEGNDCRGFSGRPDGYSDWTCPPKRTVRTKLAGEGRLWMMCCAPSISNAAQSAPMAVILPPEMRHSRPAPFRWSGGGVG